jgi:hypothetical protein
MTMRSFGVLLVVLLVVVALPASAITLCGKVSSDSSGSYYAGTPYQFTCPGINIANGWMLTSVTLYVADDASGPANAAPATVVNTWSNVAGSFLSLATPPTITETSTDGFTFGPCTPAGPGGGCPLIYTFTPMLAGAVGGTTTASIMLSVALSQVPGITQGTGYVDANLSYAYTEVQTGVPEPATMSLVGLAMLGLGVMVRKGRKA